MKCFHLLSAETPMSHTDHDSLVVREQFRWMIHLIGSDPRMNPIPYFIMPSESKVLHTESESKFRGQSTKRNKSPSHLPTSISCLLLLLAQFNPPSSLHSKMSLRTGARLAATTRPSSPTIAAVTVRPPSPSEFPY